MSLPKITVIGAGNVGATLAQRLVEMELGHVVLLDVVEGLARGKAMDLNQSAPIVGQTARVTGSADYHDSAHSKLIIITSGSPRKPGMSRDDLLKTNYGIVRSVVEKAAPLSPQAILLIVTNPLDAMVHTALRASGFPRARVLGMAGVLDSARLRTFLAEALRVSPATIETMVLGGHGDDMVPCQDLTRVAGGPVGAWLTDSEWNAIIVRTRQGGAEIVRHLQTGSAFYAPSAAAARMAASILRDEHAVLPCAVRLDNEYGLNGQVLGVPVKLGRSGAETVIEVGLSPAEKEALAKSAESVRGLCAQIDAWWIG